MRVAQDDMGRVFPHLLSKVMIASCPGLWCAVIGQGALMNIYNQDLQGFHVILSAAKDLRSRHMNRQGTQILRCAQDDRLLQ